MRHSESLANIAPALVTALSEIGGVKKGASNPAFRGSKYATLEAVIEASKGILAENDIALLQFPGAFINGSMTLETVLFHASGEWITGQEAFGVVLGKHDPQGVGSALTYARRYAQQAVLNMPAVDDDGNAASGPVRKAPGAAETPNQPPRDRGVSEVDGKDWWGAEGAGMTAHQAKKDGWDDRHEQMRSQIDKLTTAASWKDWCAVNADDIKLMPKSWRIILRGEAEERGKFLGAIAA